MKLLLMCLSLSLGCPTVLACLSGWIPNSDTFEQKTDFAIEEYPDHQIQTEPDSSVEQLPEYESDEAIETETDYPIYNSEEKIETQTVSPVYDESIEVDESNSDSFEPFANKEDDYNSAEYYEYFEYENDKLNWPGPGEWPRQRRLKLSRKPPISAANNRRNAYEAVHDSNRALIESLLSLNGGDLSNVPADVLEQISPATLAQLPPAILETLPREIATKLTAAASKETDILVNMLQYMPLDRLTRLPWNWLGKALSAKGYNQLTPTVLGAIPWTQILPVIPEEVIAGLSLTTLQYIPGDAWRRISFDSVGSIRPAILCNLPLNSLRSIPPGHLMRLGCDTLGACPKDTLNAIHPNVLRSALDCGLHLGGRQRLSRPQGIAASTFRGGEHARDGFGLANRRVNRPARARLVFVRRFHGLLK